MLSRQPAILTKTLNLRWFGGKTKTIELGTPIEVSLKRGGFITSSDLETRFEASDCWVGYHQGFYFRLKPEYFTIRSGSAA